MRPSAADVEAVEAHERGTSTSSITAAMTIAAERRLGKVSKSPVKNSSVMTIASTATTIPESCERAPAEPLTAVLDRLPPTTMPLESPGADVRGAETEQLAVGVDLVVVPGGVGLGWRRGPPRSRSASLRWPHPVEVQVVPGGDVGKPDRREPRCDRADDLDPVLLEAEQAYAAMPSSTASSDGGHDAALRLQRRARGPATQRRRRAWRRSCSPSSPRKPQSCSKKLPWLLRPRRASAAGRPMIVSARPMMKPFSTGSEMKLARNPSRSSSGDEREHADDERQRDRELQNSSSRPLPGHRPRPPIGPRSPPSGRHELTRASERGIQISAPGAAYRPTTGETPAIVA